MRCFQGQAAVHRQQLCAVMTSPFAPANCLWLATCRLVADVDSIKQLMKCCDSECCSGRKAQLRFMLPQAMLQRATSQLYSNVPDI
jgi:hypothetical protein